MTLAGRKSASATHLYSDAAGELGRFIASATRGQASARRSLRIPQEMVEHVAFFFLGLKAWAIRFKLQ